MRLFLLDCRQQNFTRRPKTKAGACGEDGAGSLGLKEASPRLSECPCDQDHADGEQQYRQAAIERLLIDPVLDLKSSIETEQDYQCHL
jgi:hypothetical protein